MNIHEPSAPKHHALVVGMLWNTRSILSLSSNLFREELTTLLLKQRIFWYIYTEMQVEVVVRQQQSGVASLTSFKTIVSNPIILLAERLVYAPGWRSFDQFYH